MKKLLLTFGVACTLSVNLFAQVSAGEIWSLNSRVDPIVHTAINFSPFDMTITYSATGAPTAITANPRAPYNTMVESYKSTSTVTGNQLVTLSEKKDPDETSWVNYERVTFINDGTMDTSVMIEKSNNGDPFAYSGKYVFQKTADANVNIRLTYKWENGEWVSSNKAYYYSSAGRIDSMVNYKFSTPTDSVYNLRNDYYYSNGLDSSLETVLQSPSGLYEVQNKIIVKVKEGGKTKAFALSIKNNNTYTQTAYIEYLASPATALNEIKGYSEFTVYPNPANNQIAINLANGQKASKVIITNIQGQQLYEIFDTQNPIDISALNNGIYFVNITSENGTSTQKFIKQ